MSISRCTPAANAGWIIGGKVCLALIHLGVSMCAARLLGTAGFGEIQYAAAISGLLLPLCTLGLHDVLVPELVRCPKNSGAALGTAIGMRLAASLGVLATWYLLLCLGASGVAVPSVALLYGIGLIFQAAEPLADWFRSRLQSVLPVLISCAAAAAAALCQVGLLLAEQGTPWFALAHGLEAAVDAHDHLPDPAALKVLRAGADQLPDLRQLAVPGVQSGVQVVYDPVSTAHIIVHLPACP